MQNIRERYLPLKVTVAPNTYAYAFSKDAEHSKSMHVASAIYYTLISIHDRLSANDLFECVRFIQSCKSQRGHFTKAPQWFQVDIKDKLALLVQAKLFNQPIAWELPLKEGPKWFNTCVKMSRRNNLNPLDVISYCWYLISTPLYKRDIEEQWLSTLVMYGYNDVIDLCCNTWEKHLSKKYKRGMRDYFAEKYGKEHPLAANTY